MTGQPGAVVQCALEECDQTWEWMAWRDLKRYCSPACANLAHARRVRTEWYEARCLQCGEVAGSWLMAEARYANLCKAGWVPNGRGGFRRARCLRCDTGLLLIEPAEMANLHSALRARKGTTDTWDWGTSPLAGVA